jgi:hypothetical protein
MISFVFAQGSRKKEFAFWSEPLIALKSIGEWFNLVKFIRHGEE